MAIVAAARSHYPTTLPGGVRLDWKNLAHPTVTDADATAQFLAYPTVRDGTSAGMWRDWPQLVSGIGTVYPVGIWSISPGYSATLCASEL